MTQLPSGTVTFLFTDIEGSTRLWQEQADAMRPALARHDELLRAAIEAHDGYVVKTTGDGAHAAFTTASDAIAAAVDAQLAIAGEAWPLPAPLRVRMGIHTGPAELRDGDYYGPSVNRSARIMSVAHGGQIVLSAVTRGLAQEDGIETVDLGAHRLKDLTEAETLFQVLHPGLEREFPPLRSLDRFASNLPTQVTSFVGREEEVDRVVGLLGDSRLVTLAGTGGVGKTRLSLQVAAEVGARFADGVWFCELAVATDGDTTAQVIASTLGCLQHPGLSLAASIVEYVKVRELLLVLDNCEHLLDDVADFAADVLRTASRVTVLATSREGLDVPGEQVVRLRSLATPTESAAEREAQQSPAVQLFRDRAGEAGADLDWDTQEWTAAAEVCRRVDGIPLAIELAAARTVSMRPVDIARHLDERFRLLTGQRRGRVERHQTLRATVEWSYQLLSDDERSLFDRLGTFPGSFDEPAAVAVAGGDDLDAWTVTDALASLVAKSMLATEAGPDRSTRYRMLETLRHYAREQLEAGDHADGCRRAHAQYFAALSREMGEGALGPDDVRWRARIRVELDNLRAAVLWALDRDDHADQQLALAVLAPMSYVTGEEPDLGLDALAFQVVPIALDAEGAYRSDVLMIASHRPWYENDIDEALRLARLAYQDGVVPDSVNPLCPLATLMTYENNAGNTSRALQLADEARAAMATLDDRVAPYMLASMALNEAMIGHLDDAQADAEEALRLAQQLGNQAMFANANHALMRVLQRDDPEAALAAFARLLDVQRSIGVHSASPGGAGALAASIRSHLGDDAGALELLHEALVVSRDDGTLPMTAAVLAYAVRPLRHTGRNDAAAVLIGAMDHGAVANVANFPGLREGNARALARIRDTLGDEKTDALLQQGASLSRDELYAYALTAFMSPAPGATP